MTDTLDALLAAVCAEPGNDAVRAVFADAAEEAGDVDHAAFVRAQLRLAQIGAPAYPVDEPNRCNCESCSLRREERRLLDAPCVPGGKTNYEWWFSPFDEVFRYEVGGRVEKAFTWEFRRGFVESVSCRLATWVGGVCDNVPHCVNGRESRGAFGMRPCYRCNGSGHTPGHGPAICRRAPVQTVVLTDMEPVHNSWMSPGEYGWWGVDSLADEGEEYLRSGLWHRLPGGPSQWAPRCKTYPSRETARAALSTAAILHAKQQERTRG